MLLEEILILSEKLGNLSKLNAGALLPGLMAPTLGSKNQKKKIRGDKRDIEQKLNDRIMSYHSHKSSYVVARDIGNKSKISDLGPIKSFAEIKKTQEDNAGFAIYLNNKIVFLIIPEDDLNRRATQMKASWYPSAFEEGASNEAKVDAVTPTIMKTMIDGLIKKSPKGAVTAKIISSDEDRIKSRYTQYSEFGGEEFSGKKALAARLAKYKLTKNPSAKDIEEFFTMALSGKNSKIRLDDKTYELSDGYETVKTNAANAAIFKGKPFKIKYTSINISRDYSPAQTVIITMKFFPETMTIAPISIEHSGNLKAKAFNKDEYIRDKLDIKGEISKEIIIKKLLTLIKDNKLNDAKNGLKFVRNAEYDWPELDRIEKAITAKKED